MLLSVCTIVQNRIRRRQLAMFTLLLFSIVAIELPNVAVGQQRPDRFVRVMQHVTKSLPDAKGWIVGDGPLRAATEKLVQELGLQESVRFWGYQADVAPFLAAADALLVSSDSDGIPTAV